MKAFNPVYVEVVSKVLTVFQQRLAFDAVLDNSKLRKTYNDREINEYPDEIKEEMLKLSDWIRELTDTYRHRLVIRLIDAQSLLGLYKSIRWRFRKTPTFIIAGRETYTGWDKEALESILDRHMAATWN